MLQFVRNWYNSWFMKVDEQKLADYFNYYGDLPPEHITRPEIPRKPEPDPENLEPSLDQIFEDLDHVNDTESEEAKRSNELPEL